MVGGELLRTSYAPCLSDLPSYVKENKAGLILVTHENDLALRCDKVYKLEDLELKEFS